MHFTLLAAAVLASLPSTFATAARPPPGGVSARFPAATTQGWSDDWVLAGPAPFSDVKSSVADLKASGNHPPTLDRRFPFPKGAGAETAAETAETAETASLDRRFPSPGSGAGAETGAETAESAGLAKRVCEGVYFCDGENWTGSCYYACYPISEAIYPSAYWVDSIKSAGPDQGGWCDFYAGGACDAGQFEHVIFYYPGGNLPSPVADSLGCFYCNPV